MNVRNNKWFTRKNPWYSLFLTLSQQGRAALFFNKDQTFWGAYFMWCSGYNVAMTLNPSVAPEGI